MRNLSLTVLFNFICLLFLKGQEIHIRVTDETSKDPLPSVFIHDLKKKSNWVTDSEGKTSIHIDSFELPLSLELSFVGYKSKIYTVTSKNLSDKEILISMTSLRSILEEVIVLGTRVKSDGVFAKQDIKKEEIQKLNLGQDLPLLINQATSVVTSTDAGNGVGYTGIRIRGTDPTRINVTINGIPVNDAESQSVYWVNMPDFASGVQSVQIQRGVGTSSNGQGAFGATLNLQTENLSPQSYAHLHSSSGSFNTFRNTIKLGTGLINNKWSFDGRLSKITSDGYIDRASSNLQSQYISGGYFGKNDIVKFIYFGGKEKTYQAWNGVSEENLQKNRTYNFTGAYTDASGQTRFYENETDNYWQDNFQLHWSKAVTERWMTNIALHYTRGKGYFEQYQENDKLSKYGLKDIILSDSSIKNTDLIRQRWLDNHFGGFIFSANYLKIENLDFSVGGGFNVYDGDHFGRVIWARFMSNGDINHEYYNDNAIKRDGNIYSKLTYNINKNFKIYGDLQLRYLNYKFVGFNEELRNDNQQVNYLFFNPKTGITYQPATNLQFFASYSVGSREPNRRDFTRSSPETRPRPEYLYDLELGWKHGGNSFHYGVTLYNMTYKDQLILTGQINDVGDYTRTNVKNSFRRGIELESGITLTEKISLAFNTTLSTNKIKVFDEFLDVYDADFNYLEQKKTEYKNTDIAFSPSLISGLSIQFKPLSWFDILINNKYVARQYLDNTQQKSRSLNPFFTTDILLTSSIKIKNIKEVKFNLLINNLWNALYENNGYTYGWILEGNRQDNNFYFPQAGINGLLGLSIKL
jgi:iron complex outermembrane receptor protein